MKLSDYIVQFLVDQGIKHVFVVSGGAIVHSIDSVARHPDIDYICVQHEQSAAAAADAYARVTGNLGAVMVTSGPGASNLTTSICNAYYDSIPIICICGQVTTFRLRPSQYLRQKGFQETDVVSMFKPITKYAVQVLDPLDIKYELQKAVYLARTGRPGPVVLDIPDDLQRNEVDVEQLREFEPLKPITRGRNDSRIEELILSIQAAERPVIVYGAGVRLAGAAQEACQFAEYYQIPVLLTWGGKDVMPHDHELNNGVFGVCGPRAGNFAVQNADLVIAVGTRLSQMITGGKQNLFAPHAKKIMIDIDEEELTKFTTDDIKLDLRIKCDAAEFYKNWKAQAADEPTADRFQEWRTQIQQWEKEYPVCPPEKYNRQQYVDAHVFIKELSKALHKDDIIIPDTGANICWTLQALEVKKEQRVFSAWSHTPMGYALPASIGAALAHPDKRVICLIGDGGMMMCLSELATIKRYNLPVYVFVFNNHGHSIQKQTIDTWLNANYAAVDEKTGLSFPDFIKMSEAFGLPACTIENHAQLASKLKSVFSKNEPVVCDVEIDPSQKIEPMLKFGGGLEDLNPKLSKEQLAAIMSVSKPQNTLKI